MKTASGLGREGKCLSVTVQSYKNNILPLLVSHMMSSFSNVKF